MADGNKVQYWIEVGLKDDAEKGIRAQMSKWDWKEIMGIDLSDVFSKEGNEAVAAFNKAIASTDIDWEKVLGSKKFKSAIHGIITESNKQLREGFFSKKDAAKVTEFIGAVNEAMGEFGAGLDTAGLVRSLTAFAKAIAPLRAEIEALADAPEKVRNTFDKVFGGIAGSADQTAKSFNKMNSGVQNVVTVFAKMDKTLAKVGGLKEQRDQLLYLYHDMMNAAKATDYYKLSQEDLHKELLAIEKDWESFDASRANPLAEYNPQEMQTVFKYMQKIVGLDEAWRSHKNNTHKTGIYDDAISGFEKLYGVPSDLDDATSDIINAYKKDMQNTIREVKESVEELNRIIPKTLGEQISEAIKKEAQIEIPLTISENERQKFITEVNKFVADINASPIEKVKIQLDDASKVVGDKTKRQYKNSPTDEDAATTEIVNKTTARFDRIANVIQDKQQSILTATDIWRQKMIQAMSIKAQDLEFKFGSESNMANAADSLFNQLQEYFERPEYAFDINFDTEKIAKKLKAGIEAEGIELGLAGGSNIDASNLISEIYSALFGKVPASNVPANALDSTEVLEDVAKETTEVTSTSEEYVKVLDETSIHIDKVIVSLREFAKQANKAKASKGSIEIANRLREMGIDVSKITKDTGDAAILKMIQEGVVRITKDKDGNEISRRHSLMAKDEMGRPQGSSLVAEIRSIMSTRGMDSTKGAGKFAEILAKDILELFNINGIETEFEEEVEKRLKQLNLWNGIEKPGKALAALGKVRSTKNKINLPDTESIDQAIKYFGLAGEDTTALSKLKEARQKFDDDGQTDAAKAEFEKAANEFYEETKGVFNRLKARWGGFKGTVQAEGRRPVTIKNEGAYPMRILELPDDAVITRVDGFEVFKTVGDDLPEREQKKLNSGASGYDMLGPKPTPKKDVRYESIEYNKFKIQEEKSLPPEVALKPEMEALKARADEVPELIKRIDKGRRVVADLENTKQQLQEEIGQMQIEELPEVKTTALANFDKRRTQVGNIIKNAQNALQTNGTLDVGNTSKLGPEQSALANRLQSLLRNIHNDTRASQELQKNIWQIEEARKLSNEELEALRNRAMALEKPKAEQSRLRGEIAALRDNKDLGEETKQALISQYQTEIDKIEQSIIAEIESFKGLPYNSEFYKDILFNAPEVDKRLAGYQSQKTQLAENIRLNRGHAQERLAELEELNRANTDQAAQEAKAVVDQLTEIKTKLYAEAQAYATILENPETDENTRKAVLGKMQNTLIELGKADHLFASIPAEGLGRPSTLLDKQQSQNLAKWNKAYTNKDVSKLKNELDALEQQLKAEEDEAKKKELKKQIANTKRAITNRKKVALENVNAKTRTQLSDRERELKAAQLQLSKDENALAGAQKAQVDYKQMSNDAKFVKEYNKLLAKEKKLLEEVNNLKKAGADEEKIEKKIHAAKQATKALDDFVKKNATAERSTYAREAAIEYQVQLQTAYRKRSVFDSKIEALDEDERNLRKYGLSGRVGSAALRRAKYQATNAYMNSDEVKAQIEAIRRNEELSWEQRDEQIAALRKKLRKDFEDKFNDANVVQNELDRIAVERKVQEEGRAPLDNIIEDLKAQREAAKRYGSVTKEDLSNDKYLKQNEAYNRRIIDLNKQLIKQQQELEDIKSDETLDEKTQEKKVRLKQQEIDVTNREIQHNQTLIENRQKLMELHRQEKEESKQTPEERALLATEKLVGLKQSLAKVEENIATSQVAYESAKGTENETKTLEALDDQIKKRDKIQRQIAETEQKIERLNVTTQTGNQVANEVAATKSETSNEGGILSALMSKIEAAVGDGLNVDATGIAQEETLSKILEILSAFKNGGVPVVGRKQAEVKEKVPKVQKSEAELIRDNALKQHDVVRGLAAGRGSLYDQYMKDVDDLNKAVKEANAASEKNKKRAIAKVKTKAQQVSSLSYNILKNTSQWDMLVANSDSGAKNLNLKQGESLRDKMELMAKKEAGILGKHGGVKTNPKYKYDFLGFDGDTLTYQLTDIEGNIRKVTMVWNEFNKQVAITSDKTGSKLSELAQKVETFGNAFENAIDAGYLAENDADLKRFKDAVIKIQTEIGKGASFDDIDKLRNKALQIADEVTKKVNKVKRSYAGTTEMNSATTQRNKLDETGILEGNLSKVKEYNDAYNNLIATHQKFKTEGTLYDENNQRTLRNLALHTKALGKELEIAQQRSEDLKQKVLNSGTYNGKAIGDISQVQQGVDIYDQMRAKLEELGATNIKVDRIHQRATGTIRHNNRLVSDLEVSYDELEKSLARYHKQERESLTGVPAFLNGFQKKFNSIMQYLSMTMSIHRIISEVRRGVQYIREIDKALTELKKVTNETEETYRKFLDTAAKTAAKVGSTIQEVVSSTADWARLGYSMEQAAKFAETTQILMNVSEFTDVSQATDTLISAVQAFGYTAETSMDVVDLLNTIGNNYAISTADLAQSLTKSSASLVAAGGDLAEAAALTATANKIIQDADSVGTALKTTSLRLRGTEVSVLEEEGLDSDGAVTSKSKLQSKVKALSGVDILTATGEYKSTYKILSEIADVWEDISDIDQAALLELISGKRNSSVIAAILQNPKELKAAFEDANNAAGSAIKENEKYLDSIQGKIDQFNNSVQAMWSNTLDSGLVKDIVTLGTELVKIVDTIGLIPSVIGAIGITKLVPWLLKGVTSTETLGSALRILAFGADSASLSSFELITNLSKLFFETTKGIPAMVSFGYQAQGLSGAMSQLGKGINMAWAAIPGVGKILLIAAAIGAVVAVVDALTTSTKELAQAAEEALTTYENAQNTLKSHKETIEEISDDYKKLSKGVNAFGENVSLTTEEYERYNKVANQIADMFPEMVSGYTEEGNAILTLKGNVDALTEAYKAEAQAANDALLTKSKDIFDTFKNNTVDSGNIWTGKYDKIEDLQYIEDLLDGKLDNFVATDFGGTTSLSRWFKAAGIDGPSFWDTLIGKDSFDDYMVILNEHLPEIQAYYRTLKSEVEAETGAITSIINAYLYNDFDYAKLTANAQTIVKKIVSTFDAEFYAGFNSSTDLMAYISRNLIEPLQNTQTTTELETALNLQTQFNNGEVSIQDYESKIKGIIDLIDTLNLEKEDEIIKAIRLVFDVDENGNVDSSVQNVAKNFLIDEYDVNVGQLTKSDLEIVDRYATEFEKDMSGVGYTWDEFIAKIKEKKLVDAFSVQDFEKVSDGLDSIQNAYKSLSDAVEQYNSTGYLTLDSLQAILSLEPEYLALLQMENGQLTINQAAAEAMIQTKLAEAEANAIQSAMTQLETLAKEAATKATNDNATAATNAITSLGNYSSALGTVAQDAIMAAGAVSALNNAVDGAKEAGVSEEDIKAVMSNLDTYLSLINTTRENLSTSFVPIVTGGTGGNPEEDFISDGWESLINKYENRLALITNERDRIQAEIDQIEAQGGKASEKHYADLIASQLKEKQLLEDKKAALEEYLRTYGNSIDPDTWTDYNNEINKTAVAIKECATNIYEFAKSLRELDMHYFEQTVDELSHMGDEIDFILKLFDNEEMFDDEGNWTEAGVAKINLLQDKLTVYAAMANEYKKQLAELDNMEAVTDENGTITGYKFGEEFYNTAKQSLADQLKQGFIDGDEYNDLLADLDAAYANGGFSVETFNEWKDTYTDGYRDAISAGQDAQDELINMNDERVDKVIEGIEDEISAYEDYIDTVKDALDAERDLYDFKKSIEKDSKNVAAIERRIAALSGATDAASVAERRKLEAELMDAKDTLNESYRNHSQQSQQDALDDEVNAYRTAKEKYIDILEESRDDTVAILNDMFLNGILNADVALEFLEGIEEKYNVPMSQKLKAPFEAAADQADKFKEHLSEEGFISGVDEGVIMISNTIKDELATEDPENAWTQATDRAGAYADFLTTTDFTLDSGIVGTFAQQVQGVVDGWGDIGQAAKDAYNAQVAAMNVGGNPNLSNGNNTSNGNNNTGNTTTTQTATAYLPTTRGLFSATGIGSTVAEAQSSATTAVLNKAYNAFKSDTDDLIIDKFYKQWKQNVVFTKPAGSTNTGSALKKGSASSKFSYAAAYAKGTTGTSRNQLAIVDELGPELILHADPTTGRLQYLTKGSGVVPAMMTENLMEWGQFTPDSLNLGGGVNVNMINNSVIKPQYDFNFDSLVHVDHCDQGTLKDLEKMVDNKIDKFSKDLNYSIKRFAR